MLGLFWGVLDEEKRMIFDFLGYEEGEFLVKYLGVFFFIKRLIVF